MSIDRRRATLIVAAVVVVTLPLRADAQEPTKAGTQDHPHEVSDFAAASLAQCQLAMASVDDIARLVADARRSADVSRMHASLDAAARAVREVRQHLGSCADILKLMPQTGKRTLRFTTTTATLLEVVCGAKTDPATVPTVTHEGQQYFFCSEADRDEFQKNPAQVLAEPHR